MGGSAAGMNRFVGRFIGVVPGAPELSTGGKKLDDANCMT